MKNIVIKEVSYDDTDFICLCDELDSFLNCAIGGEDKREKYKKFNHLDTMDHVIVAYDDEAPVGCAALRKYSDENIEVKRVFVREDYRGKNIAGMLIENLIAYSKNMGYTRMILETGEFLKASVRLYLRYGFEKIPNYGEYADMSESFCMARSIKEDDIIFCENRWIDSEPLWELFSSVGWLSANYAQKLAVAFRNAGTVISAWQGERLVGLAEVLDDGELNAYIYYLLVAPDFQNRGIGSRIIEKVKDKYARYLYLVVICEKKDRVTFYERCGFVKGEGATPLQIRML